MKIRTSRHPPGRVAWHLTSSPAGKLVIGITEKKEICRISFMQGSNTIKILAGWHKDWPQTKFTKEQKEAINTKNIGSIKIFLIGTPFQYAVWRALAKIPLGQTRTYGAVARSIGRARAVRAVGGACGANPVPFLIPCHRVVAAKGLGGFSSGLEIKKKLLKMEKASL